MHSLDTFSIENVVLANVSAPSVTRATSSTHSRIQPAHTHPISIRISRIHILLICRFRKKSPVSRSSANRSCTHSFYFHSYIAHSYILLIHVLLICIFRQKSHVFRAFVAVPGSLCERVLLWGGYD